jgi:dTDP-4-amino-4,6-dideoxygalactose transaminase
MTDPAFIPQADPRAEYFAQKADIDAAVGRALGSGRYILGPEVEAFEREFAAYTGTRFAISVANGTDALTLALKAMGIGPGMAVATVSHTAVATVAAVELAGAATALVDIDRGGTMDPDSLAALLARPPANCPKIGAIIPVHLYGQPAALEAILAVADGHGIPVLEDCAQAHGARYGARRVGSFGIAAAYSFYPTKNLGAIGDGGAVTTDSAEIATRLRELRTYGWRERYVSATIGQNSRLDELQAAILRIKLGALEHRNAARAAIASQYDEGLTPLAPSLEIPWRRPGTSSVFHQYAVVCDRRDELAASLKARGVGTNVHYPVPVHLQPAYRGRLFISPTGLSVSERAALRVLSLPMFAELGQDRANRVVAAIEDSLRAQA